MNPTPPSPPNDAFRPPELKSVFTGEHAWCGEKMMLSRDLEGALPLAGFFSSPAFTEALDRYAQTHGGSDQRAVASMWSLYYFAGLTIPFIVARRADYVLPVDLSSMTIALAEDGLPRAFGLETEGDWSEADAADGADGYVVPLVHRHLAAVIAAMKAAAGLAPKLAWNNAAVYIDYAFNATAPTSGSDAWASRALFEQPVLADGTANPFRGCLRHEPVGDETVCRRKVCCLRYLLPGIPSCGALCALPSQRGEGPQRGH
ncbi:siderophore-iron reductase FhuF [Rhizobium sp. 9140]|uniref:siderophore-iron reductase FhuF n=1 Tax=Rhizobium sp. 9140 TaxID=1761900 RepID=UPI0007931E39|nr:siderophore-iron reductase FhuF [Rhizobium sp. 9140]CZT35668.1 ferric iron reductase protein FhuF [Rhizobium sp. 9140]